MLDSKNSVASRILYASGAIYEYLEGGQSQRLKRIRNLGDSTAFIRVDVAEVVYEGDEPRELALHAAGGTQTQRAALFAGPRRLIIPGKGQQATRLVLQDTAEHERYFRVRFVPVAPKKGLADWRAADP